MLIGNIWSPQNKGDLGITAGLAAALGALGTPPARMVGVSLLPPAHPDNRILQRALGFARVFGNPLTPGGAVATTRCDRLMAASGLSAWQQWLRTSLFRGDPVRVARRWLAPDDWEAALAAPAWLLTGGAAFYAQPGDTQASLARVTRLLFLVTLGKALGRCVGLAPQSLGPVGPGVAGAALRAGLGAADFVLWRESLSAAAGAALGLPAGPAFAAPDAAWWLDPEPSPAVLAARAALPPGPTVGIAWRALPGATPAEHAEHEARLGELVARLRAEGLRPVLVAHVTGPGAGAENDVAAAQSVRARLRPAVPLLDMGPYSPGECAAIYGGFQVAIGLRFHFCLFAWLAGCPAVALSYRSPKHVGTYRDLGLGELAFETTWTPPAVVAATLRAMRDREALAAHVAAYRDEARRTLCERLATHLGGCL